MNVAACFCKHFNQVKFEDFSPEEIYRAKIRLLDCLGLMSMGYTAAGNDMLFEIINDMGGKEEATVVSYNKKVPAMNAAMMNSALVRSYDFEPVEAEGKNHARGAAHISSVTIPTALAVAEAEHADGKKMLTALILGDDIVSRVAIAGDSNPFDSFWDNTGTFDALGSAVIAGYLMDLDEEQMRNAMGLVVNQMGGSIGNIFTKKLAFKLPGAVTARNGIFSAALAKKGFDALDDPLAGRGGYFDIYCNKWSQEVLLEDLGKVFYADATIKPHAACRSTHAPIDTAVEIHDKYAPDLEKIKKIILHITPIQLNSFVGGEYSLGPIPQISGAFSLRFTVINALVRGSLRPEHYTAEKMSEPIIVDLLEKIELVGDLDASLGAVAASDLEVIMEDGTVYTASAREALGDIYFKPMTEDKIIEKYYANIAFGGKLTKEQAALVKDIVMRIEELDDVSKLMQILA